MKKNKKVENKKLNLEQLREVLGGGKAGDVISTVAGIVGTLAVGSVAIGAVYDHYENKGRGRKAVAAFISSGSIDKAKAVYEHGELGGGIVHAGRRGLETLIDWVNS